MNKNRWRNLVILAAAVAGLVLAYLLWPGLQGRVDRIAGLVATGDILGLREYIRSFGIWAPIVSALVMVLQAVLFPLPAFVVTVTNGLLFGAFWGTVLSWGSAMVGAALCYGIARVLGRPAVERLVSRRALAAADRFFDRYGSHSVLIARLVPVVSFDVVSYVAGVTSISFVGFFVATGIGQLPATIVYSVLGENLPKIANLGLVAFGVIAALLVLAFAVKKALEARFKIRESNKVEA